MWRRFRLDGTGDRQAFAAASQPATRADEDSVRALIRAREPAGIGTAYDRWGTETFAIARRLLDQPGAEDVTFEAFLYLWRQPATELAKHPALRAHVCRWVAEEAVRRRTVMCRDAGGDER